MRNGLWDELHALREELLDLVCDEDLTDDKLRDASEGVIPLLADALGELLQEREEPQKSKRLDARLLREAFGEGMNHMGDVSSFDYQRTADQRFQRWLQRMA